MENNWQESTIEILENVYWEDRNFESHLVKRCFELRKIKLENFTVEDLRIMVGQEIGLEFLLPKCFEILKINLFAEGDFFEGDLLKNILGINTEFWNRNKESYLMLYNLIKNRRDEILEMKFNTEKFDNCEYRPQ
jgi:hypothetical protein